MRMSDWSSYVCSSDLVRGLGGEPAALVTLHPLGDVPAPAFLERGQGVHRLLLVEQPGRHVLRDRRRGARSAHAVLDHHRGGVARIVGGREADEQAVIARSEEHTSELQSLMRISYDVFCL